MSIIRNLTPHTGIVKTTLEGVLDSECTYEIIDNILILRTSTSDTIHITPEIGKALVTLIVNSLL